MNTATPILKASDLAGERLPAIGALPHWLRRAQYHLLIGGLVLSDSLMAGLGFWLAYLLRFRWLLPYFDAEGAPRLPFYTNLILVLVSIWLALFAASGLYQRQRLLGGTDEYARVFRATTTGLLLVIVTGFLQPALVIARAWLLLAWALTFLFVTLGRFSLRRLVYLLRRQGLFLSPAVLVGANAEGVSLARQLRSWSTSGLHVVGYVDQKLPAGTPVEPRLTVLGSLDRLEQIVAQHGVEEIILASSAYSVRDNLLQIFERYGMTGNVNIRLSSGLYEIITTGLTVREFAYVPLVGVNKVRLTSADQALKLILDYAVAIPGLIVLAPLLLLIALAIRLDSPGPALYRRMVVGTGGKPFGALKFRTMHVNGEVLLNAQPALRARLEREGKLKDDPRITRLGRFLRRASLDELPQLYNVLRRQMSLVGPRMISPPEMQKYGRLGLNLLTVKPGITGMWQVSGRSDVSYAERVQLDMYYIRNWSIWLDLQLLWQTLPAVLRRRGAY